MFEFETEEQKQIRQSTNKLCVKAIPLYQTEAYYNTVPKELFRAFAKLGLCGLYLDESYGGLSHGPLVSTIVMEEIASVDIGPAIFISVHNMVGGLIQKFGSPEQKRKYLSKFCSGEFLGAFALTEPSAGSDAASLKTTAIETSDGFILSGGKCYITSAGWAEVYIVFAKSTPQGGAQGISAFLVDSSTPGLSIGKPEKKMGEELSPIASIHLNNLHIPRSQLLGSLHQGYKIALSGLAGGRTNIAACANGISRTAIEHSLSHLKQREQFGSKLIEFQGLQFMLADMRMKHEASKLLTYQAALSLEKNPGSPENRIYPCIAKCFATDSAMSITTDAVQLLGGAGYLKDYQVERFMRDAKMLQIVEGTNQIQRVIIAREMAG